ncbi:N-acetylglucosamine/diacetylchitobiose ABC transporter substrate-binding protein, partial [Arthrobacter sp. H5]|uniref:N-acetylglucosamine/diacetylchitobiose ABC transporter substrate-binding protein n=1 Tax=Arthrobacter sp. H5 TaxID=1267973 RepID=UPI00048950C1
MNIQNKPLARRGFLRGALAAAVLIPAGGALVSCAAGGGGNDAPSGPAGEVSENNPFGVAETATVDAVIFNGGYGIDYVEFAAGLVQENLSGVTVTVAASTAIAQELQPRFVGGNPPDIIDNSGAQAIGLNTILDQLEDLTAVIDAVNSDGEVIRDTLYDGVLEPGTFNGELKALNYVLTVYGLWYSATLFEENGWTPPTTWEEAMELGASALEQDKYLFTFGQEAATYYMEMAICSAIKEGGDEVRLTLENLDEDCWSHPAIQSVFTALDDIVKAGYIQPGGSGTVFTAAQAQWSNDQSALLYPSGSWIENEMIDQTADDFQMTGAPIPTVSADSALPYTALHSAAGEPFIVPSQAANVAGGMELLRQMLSREAATNFAETKLAPTIVRDTVPEDGFGSTALVSQTTLLADAGSDIFDWKFNTLYGMNPDQLVVWNTFLSGESDAAALTAGLQEITDRVRNDDSIEKVEV